MNLITDPAFLLSTNGTIKRVSLKDILCSDLAGELTHPRTDFEFHQLRLVACLTQALATPPSEDEWHMRFARPMASDEFDDLAAKIKRYFDIDSDGLAFMQGSSEWLIKQHALARDVDLENEDTKGPQELFPFYPKGKNMFALTGSLIEIQHVCPACAGLQLFTRAAAGPQYGRGARGFAVSPYATAGVGFFLFDNRNVRQTVWLNVCADNPEQSIYGKKNDPNWGDFVPRPEKKVSGKKKTVFDPAKPEHAGDMGLMRGMFWMPWVTRLYFEDCTDIRCDVCGQPTSRRMTDWNIVNVETLGCDQIVSNDVSWFRNPHCSCGLEVEPGFKPYFMCRGEVPHWEQCLGELFVADKRILPTKINLERARLHEVDKVGVRYGQYGFDQHNTMVENYWFDSFPYRCGVGNATLFHEYRDGYVDVVDKLNRAVQTAFRSKRSRDEQNPTFMPDTMKDSLSGMVKNRFFQISADIIISGMDMGKPFAEVQKELRTTAMQSLEDAAKRIEVRQAWHARAIGAIQQLRYSLVGEQHE